MLDPDDGGVRGAAIRHVVSFYFRFSNTPNDRNFHSSLEGKMIEG
jgi:hypothetical protein